MKDRLIDILGAENVFQDESMKNHTSFKTGGNADFFVIVDDIEKLKGLIQYIKQNNINYFIIGNGTNILVKDNGFRGIIIKLNLKNISIQKNDDYAIIDIEAGYPLGALRSVILENEIKGLEFLSGIPGTIGGAIKMNAGAFGSEMKDFVIETKILDSGGNIKVLSNKEQEFSYRKSIFATNDWIILETKLKAEFGSRVEIENKINDLQEQRREKQPLEYPSAGSTFKRGEDFITAKLIDECGLKGTRIGGAEVSTKHAGFIINKDSATSSDILDLIEIIRKKVLEKFDKKIELEIVIIGE